MGRGDTSLSLQLVQCNWQIANAFSGCVVDRVRNCRRNADGADFAQPLDSKRIDELVRLVDENHLGILHAFTGTRYSAMLAFVTRSNLGSEFSRPHHVEFLSGRQISEMAA
jgi:hypothetical protein